MIVLGILVAVLIAWGVISYNGPAETWEHPQPGQDNPYRSWKE